MLWPCNTLYPQKLALSSPTSVGRSVGIVSSRTNAMEVLKRCNDQTVVNLAGGIEAPAVQDRIWNQRREWVQSYHTQTRHVNSIDRRFVTNVVGGPGTHAGQTGE
jgi:hypothetical protein